MNSYDIAEWGQPLQQRLRATPQPGPDEVLIKLSHCGVCHSDVHIREGWFDMGGGNKLKLSDRGTQLPLTPGHEPIGVVQAVGSAVQRHRGRPHLPGQPVDRLRPVPLLQGRPRQPVQHHARDGPGPAGRLRHAPAGAARALPGRRRRPRPRHLRGAGLLGRHRLLGDPEVRRARPGRLGRRARLRRRRPDGLVGAGGDGPPARHRLRHRRRQAAGRRTSRGRGRRRQPEEHARARPSC